MKVNIGQGSDTLTCERFAESTWFAVVGYSRQMDMVVVEYVGNGGNAAVTYRHPYEFKAK